MARAVVSRGSGLFPRLGTLQVYFRVVKSVTLDKLAFRLATTRVMDVSLCAHRGAEGLALGGSWVGISASISLGGMSLEKGIDSYLEKFKRVRI